MVNSTTRAFGSPFKYVQGPGEFNRLPEYSKPYGKACVIIDSFLYAELNQKLENTYGESEGEFFSICFKGESLLVFHICALFGGKPVKRCESSVDCSPCSGAV